MNFFRTIWNPFPEAEQVNGLTNEMKAIYLYNLLEEKSSSILVVTNSLFEANTLYQSLLHYTPQVLLFPMDDFLTSEALAISPEFKYNRLDVIHQLMENQKNIVITNLMGYLRYLPTKEQFQNYMLSIEKGSDYPMKNLLHQLHIMGYERETIVTKTGEMAVRGFVIDVFPVGEKYPIRLEFWGDTIDSIRTFDPETQLKVEDINQIQITPNTEFLVDSEIELPYRTIKEHIEVTNILGYIDSNIVVFIDYHGLENSYQILLDEIYHYNVNKELPGDTVYMHDFYDLHPGTIKYLENFDNTLTDTKNTCSFSVREIEPFSKNIHDWEKRFLSYLKQHKTILICLSSRYQMNKITDELELENMIVTNLNEIYPEKINFVIFPIEKGFEFEQYVVISELDLFFRKERMVPYKSNFKFGTKIRDINKLNIGDYIVHSIHGIGRYIGLKTLTKNGLKKDYLTIEYKDGDKLYIPVEKMEYISKYSSNEGIVPKINKLGTTEWEKTKLRVRKKLEDIAGKLLELYAAREASVGFAFDQDSEDQTQFEKEFPYEETADQLKVTEEIKRDMESAKPMDRLLCGDVGYGKTEVAFRAAMKAVLSGKQVAILCPTTILSNQHYQNALDRFKNFPVQIALLNRFVRPKDVTRIQKEIQGGTIDIVIGTHRILSDDIRFKDLGLLVIDEEQRFGVKHKEKIKEYKNNIDVLTLSATPIPRTLQMSMTGIRNLSLIETPPVNRYPIQTYVLEENNHMIKDAVYKELSRQGQVFILYNKIEDMDLKLKEMERLLPDARIISAHGRMSKTELEDVMLKFIHHEYDVLLCTTIIETGIDIPNVNTLIIIDADHFGLSQLYQIRGRVGRSNKIAYCYLMYHKGKSLSDVATKRLQVIKDFTELGSGFAIAMRDLSIRGAGDILGSEQAGFIDAIGIELYLKMLEEEVSKLKGKPVIPEDVKEEMPLLEVETSIADEYVEETDLKIEIHKKINQIHSEKDIERICKELSDRFGKVTDNMLIYMYEEWFEKLAKELGIHQVKQTNNFIEITLPKEFTENINGEQLFMEVNQLSRMFRFSMRLGCLVITLDTVKLEKHFIYYLIDLMNILLKQKK